MEKEEKRPRRAFHDLKDHSMEYRIKRFALFMGTHSIPQLLYKSRLDKYKEIHEYIEAYPDNVEAWMGELKWEILDAMFAGDSNHGLGTPEESHEKHVRLQEKYQVDIR